VEINVHREWINHLLSFLDTTAEPVLSVEFSRHSRSGTGRAGAGRRTGRAGPSRAGPGLSYASCHYIQYPTRSVDARTHRGRIEDVIAPEDGQSVAFRRYKRSRENQSLMARSIADGRMCEGLYCQLRIGTCIAVGVAIGGGWGGQRRAAWPVAGGVPIPG